MKSSIIKSLVITGAVLISFAATTLPSRADTIAVNENAAPTSSPAATGLVGFEFTVNQTIDLTQLGFYASSIGGGDTPQVSLFDVTSGITASPTPVYTTGNLNGSLPTQPGWNYVSVGTPITLTLGQTYLITAPIYFSEEYSSNSTFTTGSSINTPTYLIDPGFNGWANSGYNFTSLSSGANTYLSANFQYTVPVTDVPEPSTYATLSAGLLALVVLLRRRSAKMVR